MSFGIDMDAIEVIRATPLESIKKFEDVLYPPSKPDDGSLKVVLLSDPKNCKDTQEQLETGMTGGLFWQAWDAFVDTPIRTKYEFVNANGKTIKPNRIPELNVIHHKDSNGNPVSVGRRYLTLANEDPGTFMRDNPETWPVEWRQALSSTTEKQKYPAWGINDRMAVRVWAYDENDEIITETIDDKVVNKEFILVLKSGYLTEFKKILDDKDIKKDTGITNFNGRKFVFKKKVGASRNESVVTLLSSVIPLEMLPTVFKTKMYPTGVNDEMTFLKNITWESQRQFLMNAFGIVIPSHEPETELEDDEVTNDDILGSETLDTDK